MSASSSESPDESWRPSSRVGGAALLLMLSLAAVGMLYDPGGSSARRSLDPTLYVETLGLGLAWSASLGAIHLALRKRVALWFPAACAFTFAACMVALELAEHGLAGIPSCAPAVVAVAVGCAHVLDARGRSAARAWRVSWMFLAVVVVLWGLIGIANDLASALNFGA